MLVCPYSVWLAVMGYQAAEQRISCSRLQRHLSIPKGLHGTRNQFIGQPINQVAHVGFNLKPRRSSAGRCLVMLHSNGSPDVSFRPGGGCEPAAVLESRAISVGRFFRAVISPSPEVGLAPFLFQLPQTVSVGSEAPPSIPVVRGADISRPKNSVAPGVSARHKLGNDTVSPFGPNPWTVLEEHESRPNSINCPEHLADESASFSIDAASGACCANILTREPCMEAIHSPLPVGWIKQPNVSLVHVQAGEPSVCGPGSQCRAAVRVPFDGECRPVSEYDVSE